MKHLIKHDVGKLQAHHQRNPCALWKKLLVYLNATKGCQAFIRDRGFNNCLFSYIKHSNICILSAATQFTLGKIKLEPNKVAIGERFNKPLMSTCMSLTVNFNIIMFNLRGF